MDVLCSGILNGSSFIGIVNMIYVLNDKIAEMYAYFY